jgi:hypothetical protein
MIDFVAKLSKTLGGSTAAETLSIGAYPQISDHSVSSMKNGGFVVSLGSSGGGNTITPFDENKKIKPIELEL